MRIASRILVTNTLLTFAVMTVGCASPAPAGPSVAGAWQTRHDHPANQTATAHEGGGAETNGGLAPREDEASGSRNSNPTPRGGAATAQQTPIASVNGRPIARERMVDLLVRARGAEVLEQLIVLEAAEGLAAQRGLGVSETDVISEYDRALRDIYTSEKSSGSFDRLAAEAVLASVLAQRHVSHEEFMLGMRRNALLRKLANEEQVVTDAQVRAEFTRRFGPRVRVAVVRVPTLADASAIRQQMATPGREPPGTETLGPFSSAHEDVPGIIRESAFNLSVGQVSDTLRLEGAWVVVRLDEQIPAETEVGFESVKGELEGAVREKQSKKAMADLYERLFRESQVKINQPILRAEFDRAYPQR